MRKRWRILAAAMCLMIFAVMCLGSGDGSDDKKEVSGGGSKGKANKPTIEQAVLFDSNDIVITAQEYVNDTIWGEGIKVLIENNSSQNITVGCNALIVNDYNISDLFVSSVAAGKKANDTVYLSSSELNAAGIDVVGKVEMYLHIYDSDSYDTICDTDCITVNTSELANMDTTPNDEGTELYNEGGIRVVGKSVDENSFWGCGILLYCENTSGQNVKISVDDMSVNGFMTEPYFSTTVYDGKKCIDNITIFSSDLEKNDIKSVDEVEFKMKIMDADTYHTIVETDPITFKTK